MNRFTLSMWNCLREAEDAARQDNALCAVANLASSFRVLVESLELEQAPADIKKLLDTAKQGLEAQLANSYRPSRRDFFAAAALQGLLANPNAERMNADCVARGGTLAAAAFGWADQACQFKPVKPQEAKVKPQEAKVKPQEAKVKP